MNIGEAHRNVRSATLIQFLLLNKLIFIYYWRTECVRCAISNGAGGIFSALILLAQGGSVRH
jgi:hypothetical protein